VGQLVGGELAQAGAIGHPRHGIAGVGNIAFQPVGDALAVVPGNGGGQRVNVALG